MTWIFALLPDRPSADPPASDEMHKLWYWLEAHGEIVFPLALVFIVALLVFGIRRGMATNVAALEEKQARKDAIVRMMREKLLVTAEDVAKKLTIDRFRAAALLDELVKEQKLVEQRSTTGTTTYRLKGL
jgi:hypothetical protein